MRGWGLGFLEVSVEWVGFDVRMRVGWLIRLNDLVWLAMTSKPRQVRISVL